MHDHDGRGQRDISMRSTGLRAGAASDAELYVSLWTGYEDYWVLVHRRFGKRMHRKVDPNGIIDDAVWLWLWRRLNR